MPLKTIIQYQPTIKRIEKGEDVRFLLKNLRDEITQFSDRLYSLPEILENVERRGTITISFPKDPIIKVINISEVQRILSWYRNRSEGACTSCTNARSYRPYSDETHTYCEMDETKENVNDKTGQSPDVERYWNNSDCPKLEHIFEKTIEEIIAQD